MRKRVRGENLRYGPWRLGKAGIWVNGFAVVYLVITTVFSFFPPVLPVTRGNMNYSSLVFGAVVLGGLGYYGMRKRRVYLGPVVEIPIVVMEEAAHLD